MKKKLLIEENFIYYILKRGKPEHIDALHKKGQLFISSVDSIRKCDDNEQRTDKYDCIVDRKINFGGRISFTHTLEDLFKSQINFNLKQSILTYDYQFKGNIYCMTGIFHDDLLKENDKNFDNKSFGEDIIVIHNPKIFLERVIKTLNKKGFKNIKYDRVKYYKNSYSGTVGNFLKHEFFTPQNEFRIFVPNNKIQDIIINIGSIEDIATVYKEGTLTFEKSNRELHQISF